MAGIAGSFSLDDSICFRNSIFFLLASMWTTSLHKTITVSVNSYPNNHVCKEKMATINLCGMCGQSVNVLIETKIADSLWVIEYKSWKNTQIQSCFFWACMFTEFPFIILNTDNHNLEIKQEHLISTQYTRLMGSSTANCIKWVLLLLA